MSHHPASTRLLGHRPAPPLLAVLALALSIGLATTMFSVLEGYFLRPLPFEDSHRLVRIHLVDPDSGTERVPPSQQQVELWRAARSLDGVEAWRGVGMTVSGGDAPAERLNGSYVTPGLFDLLKVPPAQGRVLLPEDSLPGAAPVVVVSQALRRRLLAGEGGVLGRAIRLHGAPTTIVGVMPEGFRFPLNQDFWLPLALARSDDRPLYGLQVLGRLPPRAGRLAARAELTALAASLAGSGGPPPGVAVRPYVEGYTDPALRANLVALQGAVLAVLLVACANVAGLLLARGAARGGELAVRQALGAGRLRLMGRVLKDSLLLAGAGGALGLVLAWWGAAVLDRQIEPHLKSFWVVIRLDARVVLFTVGTVALATLLSGLVPAARLSRPDLQAALRGRAAGVPGPGAGRLQRTLVVAQVAACCALLAAAGLAVRGIGKLGALDHGFSPAGIAVAGLSLPRPLFPDDDSRRRLAGELEERLAAIPGVEAVGLGTSLPFERTREIALEALGGEADRAAPHRCRESAISPGYFAALGVVPLEGRVFDTAAGGGTAPAAILAESLAVRLFGSESAVGRRVRLADDDPAQPWRTVVGVVPDLGSGAMPGEARGFLPVLARGEMELLPWVYVPLAERPSPWVTVLVRAPRDPLALAPRIRQELAALDPDLALAGTTTLDRELADQTWDYRLFGAVLVVFAAVALVLAAAGLYGALSGAVARRTREIGVRMALGASRRAVVLQVAGGGLAQVALGLLLGLGLAAGLSRALAGLLFGVAPWDPAVLLAVSVLLLASGSLACWLPARRAAAVEPVEALAADG